MAPTGFDRCRRRDLALLVAAGVWACTGGTAPASMDAAAAADVPVGAAPLADTPNETAEVSAEALQIDSAPPGEVDAAPDVSPCTCPPLKLCEVCNPQTCQIALAASATVCDDGQACTEARCLDGVCKAVAAASWQRSIGTYLGLDAVVAVPTGGWLLAVRKSVPSDFCSLQPDERQLVRVGPAGDVWWRRPGLETAGLAALENGHFAYAHLGVGALDADGKRLWHLPLPVSPVVRAAADGSILAYGSLGDDGAAWSISPQGKLLGQWVFDGPAVEKLQAAHQLPDGGWLLAGTRMTGENSYAWLLRTDVTMKLLWQADGPAAKGCYDGGIAVDATTVTLPCSAWSTADTIAALFSLDGKPLPTQTFVPAQSFEALGQPDGSVVLAGTDGGASIGRWRHDVGWLWKAPLVMPPGVAFIRALVPAPDGWLAVIGGAKTQTLLERTDAMGSLTACWTPCECADENPCTTTACLPTGCAHLPALDGTNCGSGTGCHVADHCVAGACTPQPGHSCDDGNPCTDDGCGKNLGCAHTPTTGASCSDGLACATDATCQSGLCTAASATTWTATAAGEGLLTTQALSDGGAEALTFATHSKSCYDINAGWFGWVRRVRVDAAGRVVANQVLTEVNGATSAHAAWSAGSGGITAVSWVNNFAGKVSWSKTGGLKVQSWSTEGELQWQKSDLLGYEGSLHGLVRLGDGSVAWLGWRAGLIDDKYNWVQWQPFAPHAVLQRLDAKGQPLWTRQLGGGSGKPTALAARPDNGLLVAGHWNGKGWLARMTPAGELLWQVTLPTQPVLAVDALDDGAWLVQDGKQALRLNDAGKVLQSFPVPGRVWPGGDGRLRSVWPGPESETKEVAQSLTVLDAVGNLAWSRPLGLGQLSHVAADGGGRLVLGGLRDDKLTLLRMGAFGDSACDAECLQKAIQACDDGQPCTRDLCQTACAHEVLLPTGACGGGPCAAPGNCGNGSCTGGTPSPCNDGNACTADACASKAGCQFSHLSAPCDDGQSCTVADSCVAGACVPAYAKAWKALGLNPAPGIALQPDGGVIVAQPEEVVRLDGQGRGQWTRPLPGEPLALAPTKNGVAVVFEEPGMPPVAGLGVAWLSSTGTLTDVAVAGPDYFEALLATGGADDRVVVAANKTLRCFVGTQAAWEVMDWAQYSVQAVAVLPNGGVVATAFGTGRRWDTKGNQLWLAQWPQDATAILPQPDGTLLVVGGKVLLRASGDGATLSTVDFGFGNVVGQWPDSTLAIADSGEPQVALWTLRRVALDGKVLSTLAPAGGMAVLGLSGSVKSVLPLASGDVLVTGAQSAMGWVVRTDMTGAVGCAKWPEP